MKLIRFTFLHFLILYGLVYSNQALGGTSDYNSLIVGKWKLTYSGKSSPVHTHVEFKADGTFSYTSSERPDYEEHGIFRIENNILYELFSNEKVWGLSKIVSIDSSSLIFLSCEGTAGR